MSTYLAFLGEKDGSALTSRIIQTVASCLSEDFMQAIPLYLAALLAVAIIVIGTFYVFSPERMTGSFGLRPPASDADTRAWLRLKGIRDIASGLVVLMLMASTDARTVGVALLAFAIVPLGDMSNVLWSGGSKSTAFSVHGVTCVVELVVGLFLIHVF